MHSICPPELQQNILTHVLITALPEDEENRAEIVTSLDTHFSLDSLTEVWSFIDDEENRAEVLRELVAALLPQLQAGAQLASEQLIHVRSLATRPRSEFLRDLTSLIPLIHHLGGSSTIEKIYHAIRDTARWWP